MYAHVSTGSYPRNFLWYICWKCEIYIVKRLFIPFYLKYILGTFISLHNSFKRIDISIPRIQILPFVSDKKLIMNILFSKHITYIHLSIGQFFLVFLGSTECQEKASYSYSSHNLLFFRKKVFIYSVACAFEKLLKM